VIDELMRGPTASNDFYRINFSPRNPSNQNLTKDRSDHQLIGSKIASGYENLAETLSAEVG